jgi:outer membrane protein assembly factor BamB
MLNADGSVRWKIEGANTFTAPVLGTDGTIHAGRGAEEFVALAPDGIERWAFRTSGSVTSPAAIASDGSIYFGTSSGIFYALDPNGVMRWEFESDAPVSSPAVFLEDGRVVFGTMSGTLFCLQAAGPPAASPWPMFQADAQQTGRSKLPVPPPATPSNLRAGTQVACDVAVAVSWDSVPWSYEYEVWRGSSPEFAAASLLASNVTARTSFDDHTALFDTAYFYWVRARNSAGASEPSGPVPGRQTLKAWEVKGDRFAFSPVIDAEGNLYLGEMRSTAGTALKLSRDGVREWEATLPGFSASAVVGRNGWIYYFSAGGQSNYVTAFTAAGERKWERPFSSREGAPSDPALGVDGTLYVQLDRTLAAINADGILLWKVNCGTRTLPGAHPVVDESGAIYCATGNALLAFLPNGKVAWRFGATSARQPSVGSDGTIYVSWSSPPSLTALNSDGTLRWRAAGDSTGAALISAQAETIRHAARSRIEALDAAGQVLWQIPARVIGLISGGVLAADDSSWHCFDQQLLHLDRSGNILCDVALPEPLWDAPVLNLDGTLYLLTQSRLMALKTPSGPPPAAWAMERRDQAGTSSRADTFAPAPAPSNVIVTPFLDRLRVTWTDRGHWETNEIWRATLPDLSDLIRIAQITPGTNQFDDLAVVPGATYYYQVRLVSAFGAGPFSLPIPARRGEGATVLWTTDLPADPHTAPTIGFDGTIYLLAPHVLAIGRDGGLKWDRDFRVSLSGPVVVGPKSDLYVSTFSGLHAMNGEGEVQWTAEAERPFLTGTAINREGTLFVIDGLASLGAYHSDGTLRWRKELPTSWNSGPVIRADGVVLVYVSGQSPPGSGQFIRQLIAFDAAGVELWKSAIPELVSGRTIYLAQDNTAFVSVSGAGTLAIAMDGTSRWEANTSLPMAVAPGNTLISRTSPAPREKRWRSAHPGSLKAAFFSKPLHLNAADDGRRAM